MKPEQIMTLKDAKNRLTMLKVYKALVNAKSDFYYRGKDLEINLLEEFIKIIESKQ